MEETLQEEKALLKEERTLFDLDQKKQELYQEQY
jgi:hypothetical protein